MRILSFLILIMGFALAGGGVYYVKQFELTVNRVQPEGKVSILVARRALAEHEQLRLGDVDFVEFPVSLVPHGAFTDVKALLGATDKDLRVVKRALEAREPILESKVYELNDTGGLITRIPDGWRAVSLQIDAITGVSGFVEPEDVVDIVLNHNVEGTRTSQIVLQAVRVIAVDQNMETESLGPRLGRTVTVLVTERNALLLNVAREMGQLSLFLRGKFDPSADEVLPADPVPFTEDDLPGIEAAPADERRYVWVWRGGVREKHYLDE